MDDQHNVTKLFWPENLCLSSVGTGYLVGWNVRSFITCVAAVVTDISLPRLEHLLADIGQEHHIQHQCMNAACAVPPVVLGAFINGNINESILQHDETQITQRKQSAHIWMTIEMKDNLSPGLQSIYCCGYRYQLLPCEIIFFRRPDPYYLQYFSLKPLILDVSTHSKPKVVKADKIDEAIDKHIQHHAMPYQNPKNEMEAILDQMNFSIELEKAISNANVKRIPKYSQNKSSAVRDTWRLFSDFFQSFLHLFSYLAIPTIYIFCIGRVFAEILLSILNFDIPIPSFNLSFSLKSISASAQQIDLRLQQACFWPWQWFIFRRRKWQNAMGVRAQYITFFNSVWLVANDVIIGLALGAFLIANCNYVAGFLKAVVGHFSISLLQSTIVWLMGWPAGLKLNSYLDRFLGELFLWLLYTWTGILMSITSFLPSLVYIIGCSGYLGASMIMALTSDLLTLLSLHIYLFYIISAKIYNWQLTVIWSLFNLFRGKKYNVLRHRLDSSDYDLDQLLLGTILFTLLTFLFPTVFVYYLLFSASRVAATLLQMILQSCMILLNHFPLFVITLRLKDPQRLPGGIHVELTTPERHFRKGFLRRLVEFVLGIQYASSENGKDLNEKARIAYFSIQNVPIPVSSIFFQYLLLWRRFTGHYFSLDVMRSLVLGVTMRPAPCLQYPMLPETRPSVIDFWLMLKICITE